MKINISFVIPVYNKEVQSVLNCISSIYGIKDKIKYEIIIIDDGSKNKLSQAYKKMASKYKVRYFYQKNQGVSSARNKGIQEAKGEYIYFVDADDIVLPNSFKYKDCISQYDLIIYEVAILNTNINKKKIVKLADVNQFPISKSLGKLLLKDGLLNWAVAKLYRRNFLLENNIEFDVSKKVGEDFDFVVKVLSFNPQIQYLSRITYEYIFNEKTGIFRDVAHPKDSVKDAESIKEMRYKISLTINEENNLQENENIIYNNYIKSVFEIYSHIVHFDRVKAKKLNQYFIDNLYKKENENYKCKPLNSIKRSLVKIKSYRAINLYVITKQHMKKLYKLINKQ